MEPHAPSQVWPRGLLALRLIVFAAFFDLFAHYPVIAPYAASLGASPALAGGIVALYSLANLPGNLLAGTLLDRLGRVGPLRLGLLVGAATVAGYTLVQGPEGLILLRLLHGLVAAVFAPGAFALAGDLTPPEGRARVMGLNGALIALAAITGPAAAGFIQDWVGFRGVFLMNAGLLLIAGLAALLLLPFPQSRPQETPLKAQGWRKILPQVLAPSLGILAFTLSLGVLVTHLPGKLQALSAPAALRGAGFSAFGLVAALVMASPLPARLARQGNLRAARLGLVLVALGLALAGGWERVSLPTLLSGAGLFGLGFGLLFPTLTAEVAHRVVGEGRGRAFGFFYAVYSLGVILGSLLTGSLAQALGWASGLPALLGGLLTLGLALGLRPDKG